MSSQAGSRVHPFGSTFLRQLAFVAGAILPLLGCAVFLERSDLHALSWTELWIWILPMILLVGGAWSLTFWFVKGPWRARVEVGFGVLWAVVALLAGLLVWPWVYSLGAAMSEIGAASVRGRPSELLVLLACPLPAAMIYGRAAWLTLVRSERPRVRGATGRGSLAWNRILACVAALWMYPHEWLWMGLDSSLLGSWLLSAAIVILELTAIASLLVATFYKSPDPQRDTLVGWGLKLGLGLSVMYMIAALSSVVWMFIIRGSHEGSLGSMASPALGIAMLVLRVCMPVLSAWVFLSVLESRRAPDAGDTEHHVVSEALEA